MRDAMQFTQLIMIIDNLLTLQFHIFGHIFTKIGHT